MFRTQKQSQRLFGGSVTKNPQYPYPRAFCTLPSFCSNDFFGWIGSQHSQSRLEMVWRDSFPSGFSHFSWKLTPLWFLPGLPRFAPTNYAVADPDLHLRGGGGEGIWRLYYEIPAVQRTISENKWGGGGGGGLPWIRHCCSWSPWIMV